MKGNIMYNFGSIYLDLFAIIYEKDPVKYSSKYKKNIETQKERVILLHINFKIKNKKTSQVAC